MSSERQVVTIKASDLKAEFERASGGDGSIDFSEIGAIESKFGLSMSISADMKYWKDMKVTYIEFVDMLKRNGNIAKDGGNVKLQVARAEIDAAFAEAGGSDGIIDFEDIGRVEKKFGLPMNISGDMKYWKDMKITKDEFIEMLERNGNIAPEGEEAAAAGQAPAAAGAERELPAAAAPAPETGTERELPAAAAPAPNSDVKERVKAIFLRHADSCSGDLLSLSTLQHVVAELGGSAWPEARLAKLIAPFTQDGKIQIGAFLDWCFC